MLDHDPFDYIPGPAHAAIRQRPRNVAPLYVHQAEWKDLDAIRSQHGETHIVAVRPVLIIPAATVSVLCKDMDIALALMDAWASYCETSPHRPHSKEEALEWGKQFSPYGEIPRDWLF